MNEAAESILATMADVRTTDRPAAMNRGGRAASMEIALWR